LKSKRLQQKNQINSLKKFIRGVIGDKADLGNFIFNLNKHC
jgi:hypothetical protein